MDSRRLHGGVAALALLACLSTARAANPADGAEQAVVRLGELGEEREGQLEGRPVNFVTAELAVVALHEGQWLIRAIHWSWGRAP